MADELVFGAPEREYAAIHSIVLKIENPILHRWSANRTDQFAVMRIFEELGRSIEKDGEAVLDAAERALLRIERRKQARVGLGYVFGSAVLGRFLPFFRDRVASGDVSLPDDARRLVPAVVERIARYLVHRGNPEHARAILDLEALTADAAAAVPQAELLGHALRRATVKEGTHRPIGQESAIGRIDADAIWLEPMVAEEPIGPFYLPPATIALCREDWVIWATTCDCDGSHLLEVSAVFPFLLPEATPGLRLGHGRGRPRDDDGEPRRRGQRPLVSDDRSSTPRADLGGLSPRQAHEILTDPIDGTGPLRIADLPSSAFDAVPTLGLDNARRMLWLLDAEGPWRLDARDNLPRPVALSLLKTLEWWPGYVDTVNALNEKLSGDDLVGVWNTRTHLQEVGLIRRAGSDLSVTPEGRRLIDPARTGELATKLLRGMLVDEGYEATDPDSVTDANRGMRRRRKLLVWKLSRIHEGWWAIDDLVSELTTREILDETEDYVPRAESIMGMIMSGLLLAPLADLGLLECDLDSYSTETTRYRRTPLFGQMLHWTLRA